MSDENMKNEDDLHQDDMTDVGAEVDEAGYAHVASSEDENLWPDEDDGKSKRNKKVILAALLGTTMLVGLSYAATALTEASGEQSRVSAKQRMTPEQKAPIIAKKTHHSETAAAQHETGKKADSIAPVSILPASNTSPELQKVAENREITNAFLDNTEIILQVLRNEGVSREQLEVRFVSHDEMEVALGGLRAANLAATKRISGNERSIKAMVQQIDHVNDIAAADKAKTDAARAEEARLKAAQAQQIPQPPKTATVVKSASAQPAPAQKQTDKSTSARIDTAKEKQDTARLIRQAGGKRTVGGKTANTLARHPRVREISSNTWSSKITPPMKPQVISSYVLKGVTENEVYLDGGRGPVRVEYGQSIDHAGKVINARRNGDTWYVVTSLGIILQ